MNINEALQHCLSECKFPNTSFTLAQLNIKLIPDSMENPQTLLLQAPFPFHQQYTALKNSLQEHLPESLNNLDIQCQYLIRPHQTQLAGKMLKGVKNVIAIGSGKGGVGKSTIAANLAIALARSGARVGLLDADIYGPSIPMMFGIKAQPEVKDEHYIPVNSHGVDTMSIGLLTGDEPALIWRGPMLAKSLLQMMNLTLWDNLDYLFIDLPPGTGDIQLSLVQKIPLAGAVIVSTPQQIATLDAEKAIKMFERTNVPVLGIIENMSLFTCPQCGHEESVFGTQGIEQLCTTHQTECIARLPLARSIQEDCDKGKPTATANTNAYAEIFNQAALQLSIILSNRGLNYADRMPPVVSD